MIPVTEFRALEVSSPEPTDRTSEGTVLGVGQSINLGIVDTTDEAQNTSVCVIWWRVSDMKGNTKISNIKVWLEGTEGFAGTVGLFMDITDVWTQGKTPVQVQTGSPGTAPTSEPSPNLTKYGGGSITDITHDHTSQYIYITFNIGVNETTGEKSGLKLKVKFDYQ